MTIQFEDDNPVVGEAVAEVNELFQKDEFYSRIAAHDRFDLTSVNTTPSIIARLMRESTLVFHVDLFYPGLFGSLFKYRKTLAYTDGRYPNTLFLNAKKLNRPVAEIAATIVHESVHALDDEQTDYTFGHGNNSSVGKENTAPYWIGNLANELLSTGIVESLVFDQSEE